MSRGGSSWKNLGAMAARCDGGKGGLVALPPETFLTAPSFP